MKIYTKTGDTGSTSLVGGERVGKDDPRVDSYGTVDELTAVIAYLRDSMDQTETIFEEYREDLREILSTLMEVEATLACAGFSGKKALRVKDERILFLEQRIDYIDQTLEPITRFTIPGGHPLVSLAHICRTICRRAERCAVRVARDFETDENAPKYLNRLSDYLDELGRKLSDDLGVIEEYWDSDRE